MIKKFLFLFLLFFSSFLFSDSSAKEAIVAVPVADLIVDPYYKLPKKNLSIEEYYLKQPFSGDWNVCRRAHQLLFNERVHVLEERGPEAKVQISNFYFLKSDEPGPVDTYWTLKKNLIYVSDLKNKRVNLDKIPPPISYKENTISKKPLASVVTLKKPFYDPITKEIYSIGTRFVTFKGQNIKGAFDDGTFEAYILDPSSKKMRSTQIPKRICIRNYSKNSKDRINNFVQVLRLWSYQKEGAIPYLLGGWSWTVTLNDEFELHKEKEGDVYERKKWAHTSKTGLDCMGIIGRAAQICEIPFYFKNSTTLLKNLKHVQKNDTIEVGDILWYPGHAMVISSVKKGLLIEAAGYERGWGKVEESPIENVFQGVKTVEQLKTLYLEKKPVTILHYSGRPWKTFKTFKILKLSSVFSED